MSERTSRQVEEMKKQTIGVEIEMAEINKKPSDKGYRKILRNDRHGHPRRRFIRHLELQGQTRQKVDGNKGRQHKRIERPQESGTCNPDPHLRGH